jgi:hypothetical protein
MPDFDCITDSRQLSGTFSLLGSGDNACLNATFTVLDAVVSDGLVNGNAIVVTLSSRWRLSITQTNNVCNPLGSFLLKD